MSDDSIKKPLKSPHTVDSTNSSSVANNNSSLISPENGSTIITNGNDKFLAQTLRNYIDALKFDPTTAQRNEPLVKKDSTLEVDELLGRNKNSNAKKGKGGNAKSKVTFSSNKSSSAYLEHKSLKSQPQLSSKESQSGKREKTKSSTNTVIREWGKRPMLVESEAPWTPRNRMYQRALKVVAKARQMNPGGNPNNFPPQQQFTQQPMNIFPPQQHVMSMGYPVSNGNQLGFLPPNNNLPVGFPYGPVSPVGHQQPILTGISPMPVDINNRQLGVTIDPASGPYAYPQPGMALPVQRPQLVVYGQVNSEGVWVPFMDQQQLHQQQQQRQP